MPKIFITDRDIENQANQGITTITIDENTVITDLAYEKAYKLGVKLIQPGTDKPPAAPERPYLSSILKDSLKKEIENHINQSESSLENRDILDFDQEADENSLRAAIIEVGRLLYQQGLMMSNDGNISVRMKNGNILITPSGVGKGRISTDDLLLIDINGNIIKSAKNPSLKPTSEQPMHLEVYRKRPDIFAIIHTHLIYANALAISHGKVRMDIIPEAAIAFGEIPITEFSMPSSPQNAEAIRNLIEHHDVLLIRNHGSLTIGKNLNEALINLERLEHVSKTLTFAELLGDPNKIPQDMLDAIAELVKRDPKKTQ